LQVPDEQEGPDALAGEQGTPQAPQSLTVVSGRSQPSARLPLQSPKFVRHEA
jgi:hypothetical protein